MQRFDFLPPELCRLRICVHTQLSGRLDRLEEFAVARPQIQYDVVGPYPFLEEAAGKDLPNEPSPALPLGKTIPVHPSEFFWGDVCHDQVETLYSYLSIIASQSKVFSTFGNLCVGPDGQIGQSLVASAESTCPWPSLTYHRPSSLRMLKMILISGSSRPIGHE